MISYSTDMAKTYCSMVMMQPKYISPQILLYTTLSHLYYSLVAHIELSSPREGTALLRFLVLQLHQSYDSK